MHRYRPGLLGFLADLHQAYRFEFSGILFALGAVLVFIAAVGYVPQAREWAKGVAFLDVILRGLGVWIFWEAIVAALVMLIGGFDFADTMRKGREFEKLINTTSKEAFLKNRGRMKHLAEHDLPERYWRRIEKKKQELRVKE